MAFNLEEFISKYDVHPETVNFLKAAAASGAKPYYEIGVVAARQYSIERNNQLAGKVEFEGSEKEIFVPSAEVEGTVYSLTSHYENSSPTQIYSYDMRVVTMERGIAEKNYRLSWDSNPVCPDNNPML